MFPRALGHTSHNRAIARLLLARGDTLPKYGGRTVRLASLNPGWTASVESERRGRATEKPCDDAHGGDDRPDEIAKAVHVVVSRLRRGGVDTQTDTRRRPCEDRPPRQAQQPSGETQDDEEKPNHLWNVSAPQLLTAPARPSVVRAIACRAERQRP